MVGDYHKRIQQVLLEICAENKDKFKMGFAGNKKIDIIHPTVDKKTIIYFPDYVIRAKNGRYYIFQIIDSQEEIGALTRANVIDAYLSEQVTKLYFIAKSQKAIDRITEMSEVMLAKIEDLSGEMQRVPLQFFYITIPKEYDKDKIKETLEDALIKAQKEVDKEIKIMIDSSTLLNFISKHKKARLASRRV